MTSPARVATLALALLAAGGAAAESPVVAVAAAASLRPALEELARAFEREAGGCRVVATYGASGTLLTQLRAGAPFALFMSADRDYPRKAVEAGLAREEVVYAAGRLVAFVPRGSPAAVEARGLAALAEPAVRRVAIANPAVAPYGRAAEAALRGAGVLDAVRPKIVLGESVAQAAQLAHAGAVDAALLPASIALAPALAAAGAAFPLPPAIAPSVPHSAAVLTAARDADLARAFLAFVVGARGRAILARHGYDPP
ncbi:MAG TPA: molybdate ABC transporter substrate-binding protein [Anaeromyxobacter sp.]|nr:molybdate ABC transporter substrate-binding protein [Anaeromyxobacter sp.]